MFTRWSDLDRTFAALEDFRRRMDRAFDDYARWSEGRSFYGAGWPACNLYDAGTRVVLEAEVPGLSEKEISLDLNQHVLTLSGERKVRAPEGYAVHRSERGNIKFSRSFSLPCKVDPEKCLATVKNGILTVALEKAPEAKPRQISVKAG